MLQELSSGTTVNQSTGMSHHGSLERVHSLYSAKTSLKTEATFRNLSGPLHQAYDHAASHKNIFQTHNRTFFLGLDRPIPESADSTTAAAILSAFFFPSLFSIFSLVFVSERKYQYVYRLVLRGELNDSFEK